MMKPEAVIHVRFLTSDEGGRETPIKSDKYSCPVMVNNLGFDCRFVLSELTCFELGNDYKIPIKFLNPDIALEHLHEGTEISLWEGKKIAVGYVLEVLE